MNPQLRRVTAQQGTADPHRAPGPQRLVRDISTDWPNRETRDEADQLPAPTNVRTSAAQPTDTLLLADGTRLQLRPIGSDDRDQVAALFARLSPESRYRRFLSPKRELTPRELTFFTDIDHTNHEAIAAADPRDGSIVGVSRYVRYPDRPTTADLAIEVADELQNMGIGTTLARRVMHRARANGVALLTATTLWENQPARALLRRLEFRARASHGSVIELELKLKLAQSSPREAVRVPENPRLIPRAATVPSASPTVAPTPA
jgi:RimJ/RimL family protein N-acetyltransferase